MNINRKLYTKIALVLLGFSHIFWNSNPANALTGSLSLSNEDFTISGSGINNAPGNSTIDNTAPPNGFGNHFDDSGTFLLLGATDPNVGISSSPGNANSSGISPTFDITNQNKSLGLNLAFDWAFQGDSTIDSFQVLIANSDLSQLVTAFSQNTYGSGTFTGTVDISSLAPGTDYSVYVTLNEAIANGNSAAGFDNIAISAVAVPFEFSPGLGLLMMGGLFGGSTYLKKRKLAANVNFD